MEFFFNACREIRQISEQDVLSKRSADNITRSYFNYYTEFLSICRLPNLRRLCESNNFVQISCNVKGLVFDFYLNRKRTKCWLAACSCDLFTYQ